MIKMFLSSIRFRVLSLYIAFLLITLSLYSLILYESFKKTIYDDLDDLLSSRSEGVVNSIDTYWQAREDETTEAQALSKRDAEHDGREFINFARDWVEEKRKDPQLMSLFVQILDTKGNILIASKSTPSFNQLRRDDFDDVLKGEDTFDTVSGISARGRPTKYRVYTKPIVENRSVKYIVQVLAPATLLSLVLNNLRLILFILLPLTVLLAALPGVILVRLTLRPVDTMIDTLRQITAENLKLKIHIPDTKDEIKKLADTFNDMIERLDRSFTSQQRFIQDISAELKSPLHLLSEEIRNTANMQCSEKEHRAIFDRTLVELENFSKVIDELLTLSSFDNSQEVLEIRKVNLTRLIDEVLRDIRPLAEQKNIDISLSCPKTIVVDGDEKKLRQLLANILDNAIKYTYQKGSITVKAHKDDKFAKVSISDTGIGIPEDELDYIFDRFYQVTRSRSVNHGFGLGLSIAKSIIEAHKGAIRAESQYGKGSTFTVSLPVYYQG